MAQETNNEQPKQKKVVSLDQETKEVLERLHNILTWEREHIQRLTEENARLRSEHYKDKELQKMAEEVERLRAASMRGFTIDEEEGAQIKEWIEHHEKEVHHIKDCNDAQEFQGCIGGNYTYTFVPTSIGVIGTIKCSQCGAELTFQDL